MRNKIPSLCFDIKTKTLHFWENIEYYERSQEDDEYWIGYWADIDYLTTPSPRPEKRIKISNFRLDLYWGPGSISAGLDINQTLI